MAGKICHCRQKHKHPHKRTFSSEQLSSNVRAAAQHPLSFRFHPKPVLSAPLAQPLVIPRPIPNTRYIKGLISLFASDINMKHRQIWFHYALKLEPVHFPSGNELSYKCRPDVFHHQIKFLLVYKAVIGDECIICGCRMGLHE